MVYTYAVAVKFRKHLYYKHCDYRTLRKYKRRSTEQYIADGKKALKNKRASNGVKGITPFVKLPYFDIVSQVNYDLFHTIVNIVKSFLINLKGKRINAGVNELCVDDNVHPSAQFEKSMPKAVWVLSEKTQDRADSWINAINLPKGISGDFQVSNVFKQSGYLKGTSYLIIASCLLDFIISATDLPSAYKYFYTLISRDIADLLSNNIAKNDIDNLYCRVLEILCLHEGLWPISECKIIFHQLLDLPLHINNVGPLRGCWTLPGERGVGKVKSFVPNGGNNIDKTVMFKYMEYELAKTDEAFNFSLDNAKFIEDFLSNQTNDGLVGKLWASLNYCPDGKSQLMFTDKRVILCKKTQQKLTFINFQEFENEYFIENIINSLIQRFSVDEAIERSSFYRIFYFQEYHSKKSNRPKDAQAPSKKWSSYIENLTKSKLKDDKYFYISYRKHSNFTKRELLEGGCFLKEDIPLVKYLKAGLKVRVFRDAFIFGQRFNGRGYECREKDEAQNYRKDITQNESNNLKKYWSNLDNYSSWCKFRMLETNNNGVAHSKRTTYGQINSFIQIYLPLDDLVNGLVLVSIVARKSQDDKIFKISYIYPDNSYLADRLYILATDIVPIPIGIVGFDTSGTIHSKKETDVRKTSGTKSQNIHSLPFLLKQPLKGEAHLYSTLEKTYLQYLVPLDLNRSKKDYEFDAEEDIYYRPTDFNLKEDYFTKIVVN